MGISFQFSPCALVTKPMGKKPQEMSKAIAQIWVRIFHFLMVETLSFFLFGQFLLLLLHDPEMCGIKKNMKYISLRHPLISCPMGSQQEVTLINSALAGWRKKIKADQDHQITWLKNIIIKRSQVKIKEWKH